MSNAVSQFLRGSSAVAQDGLRTPTDADVLSAVKNPKVSDMVALAQSLQSAQTLLEPLVRKLTSEGYITEGAKGLQLSPAGERALRYAKLAK